MVFFFFFFFSSLVPLRQWAAAALPLLFVSCMRCGPRMPSCLRERISKRSEWTAPTVRHRWTPVGVCERSSMANNTRRRGTTVWNEWSSRGTADTLFVRFVEFAEPRLPFSIWLLCRLSVHVLYSPVRTPCVCVCAMKTSWNRSCVQMHLTREKRGWLYDKVCARTTVSTPIPTSASHSVLGTKHTHTHTPSHQLNQQKK